MTEAKDKKLTKTQISAIGEALVKGFKSQIDKQVNNAFDLKNVINIAEKRLKKFVVSLPSAMSRHIDKNLHDIIQTVLGVSRDSWGKVDRLDDNGVVVKYVRSIAKAQVQERSDYIQEKVCEKVLAAIDSAVNDRSTSTMSYELDRMVSRIVTEQLNKLEKEINQELGSKVSEALRPVFADLIDKTLKSVDIQDPSYRPIDVFDRMAIESAIADSIVCELKDVK